MTTLSDFTATSIDGEELPLSTYDGQVALIVNTASQCGFTPQLEGLEQLHQQYADQGLAVLGVSTIPDDARLLVVVGAEGVQLQV